MKIIIALLALCGSAFGQLSQTIRFVSADPSTSAGVGVVGSQPRYNFVNGKFWNCKRTSGTACTWTEISGTLAGSDKYVQFNDAGVPGATTDLQFDKTTKILSVTGGIRAGDGTKSSGLVLPELAANGANYFAIYGADSQSSNDCIIVSGSPSSTGDGLFYTGSTAATTETVPKTCKVMQWAAQSGKSLSCQPGLGDGLNAITAGTYLESTCWNKTGVTLTITAIQCFTDNAGSSTLSVTNGAGTALLTGAVTCSSPIATGTQSATVTIVNNDFIKFTFVADGTSKQSTWVITETR